MLTRTAMSYEEAVRQARHGDKPVFISASAIPIFDRSLNGNKKLRPLPKQPNPEQVADFIHLALELAKRLDVDILVPVARLTGSDYIVAPAMTLGEATDGYYQRWKQLQSIK